MSPRFDSAKGQWHVTLTTLQTGALKIIAQLELEKITKSFSIKSYFTGKK